MGKSYIIDMYAEIDEEDFGKELELLEGDLICRETGKMCRGTFVFKDIVETEKDDERITDERQL